MMLSHNSVKVSSGTELIRNGHELKRGTPARVSGVWRANGTIRATRIVLK
jgi:hypothetical protein